MSFNTSLSGLNAASADLGVTSNNIANVGSIGFKKSRAEFADVYAVDPFSTSSTAIGDGTLLAAVRQQFTQGNLEFTDNSLDLAISGRGFFVLSDDTTSLTPAYTRAGAFGVNADGYLANSSGKFLMGFPVNPDGSVTSTSLLSATAMQVPEAFGTPTATTGISISANVPSNAPVLSILAFDPTDATTYTNSTSVTVYDSLGNSHIATTYYIKTNSATNTWETRSYLDGSALTPVGAETLQFDSSGSLTVPVSGSIDYNTFVLTNGADPITLSFDHTGSTQFAAAFAISSVDQDGNTIGRLASLSISDTGVISANYTNGEGLPLGKIALADFRNPEGLRQDGNSVWLESADSGAVLAGEANTGRFGSIQGGALETSNVELTEQLVHLITAQRNFQANAKAIETSNNITQTIINL